MLLLCWKMWPQFQGIVWSKAKYVIQFFSPIMITASGGWRWAWSSSFPVNSIIKLKAASFQVKSFDNKSIMASDLQFMQCNSVLELVAAISRVTVTRDWRCQVYIRLWFCFVLRVAEKFGSFNHAAEKSGCLVNVSFSLEFIVIGWTGWFNLFGMFMQS